MHPVVRIFGIAAVFAVTSIAWMIFGGVMRVRSGEQSTELRGEVSQLWGSPQQQKAPVFTFVRQIQETQATTEIVDGTVREVRREVTRTEERPVAPGSTAIEAGLNLDQRLRGLMWYSLYDVDFIGRWTYTHTDENAGTLRIGFEFPSADGLYDGFRFVVDGEDHASSLRPEAGAVTYDIPVEPGQRVALEIAYRSRGMGEWRYTPAMGVANLEDFSLVMETDFTDIDFPTRSLSPSRRAHAGDGWRLSWTFERIVTGHDIGMVMPVPIQPGELAAALSFSAPVSLLFFFLILFVLGTMRGIDIHPINYLFLGGAFFAFHLLFGYSVDHVNVVLAFVICSVVSVLLVTTYLRLVVSPRFAFLEAGAAQMVYLVGFSLAHFWDGFTGLTVTVLSVLTLFLLMQLTGRVRWSEALASRKAANAPTPPPGQPAA
jgi:hypothetical protein